MRQAVEEDYPRELADPCRQPGYDGGWSQSVTI
jgi:hypothetical protein